MKRFEYRSELVKETMGASTIDEAVARFNSYGTESWEVFWISQASVDGPLAVYRVWMRREVIA